MEAVDAANVGDMALHSGVLVSRHLKKFLMLNRRCVSDADYPVQYYEWCARAVKNG